MNTTEQERAKFESAIKEYEGVDEILRENNYPSKETSEYYLLERHQCAWEMWQAAIASRPAAEPKLIIAYLPNETRRVVVASDEMINGERVVFVAIEPKPVSQEPVGEVTSSMTMSDGKEYAIAHFDGAKIPVGTKLYDRPADGVVPNEWKLAVMNRATRMGVEIHDGLTPADIVNHIYNYAVGATLEQSSPVPPPVQELTAIQRQTIGGIAKFLYDSINYNQTAPDEPPYYATQFDRDLEQAASELSSILAAIQSTGETKK